jgi:hypothetical protein
LIQFFGGKNSSYIVLYSFENNEKQSILSSFYGHLFDAKKNGKNVLMYEIAPKKRFFFFNSSPYLTLSHSTVLPLPLWLELHV